MRSEDRWDFARSYIERLETELAAATHRRDLEQEKARLASDGVTALEQRLERERAEAQVRLEERQAEMERSVAAADEVRRSLEARLTTAQAGVESREAEIARLRATVRERERELVLGEARLKKAQLRADGFRSSLVALREARSYRLMRVLWRLRRPFPRVPRDAAAPGGPPEEDQDPSPAPAASLRPSVRRAPARKLLAGERLRVASILDEMSAACFAPECDLVPLTLNEWREQLDERHPDLLLVESAWNGNGGEWQYRIAEYPRKDLAGLPALRALLDDCHERGIPTAFWNKEDPVHFDRFSAAASLFDHVFTTDARCIERYRALPGERTVTPLPFAAQPRIHNPAAVVPERSSSPCFAGAWYRDRHADRRRALEGLLDAALPYGLVIYDRSFGDDGGALGFPERFAPHVLGKLPYERILDVYKSHCVFLNANSVVDSPTMCSRRVFELAACDTAILSTPGAALRTLLGEGVVKEAGDEEAAAAALEHLFGDEEDRRRRTRAARRAVFAEHTYAERLATIGDAAGLDTSSLRRKPFAPPGSATNGAGASSNGTGNTDPWLLVLQPGVDLPEPALADLAAAATFAAADVIGAHPARNGDALIEHRHVSDLDPRALLLRRELVESRGRPAGLPEQIRAQLRQWSDDGIRLYAGDADLISLSGPRPTARASQ